MYGFIVIIFHSLCQSNTAYYSFLYRQVPNIYTRELHFETSIADNRFKHVSNETKRTFHKPPVFETFYALSIHYAYPNLYRHIFRLLDPAKRCGSCCASVLAVTPPRHRLIIVVCSRINIYTRRFVFQLTIVWVTYEDGNYSHDRVTTGSVKI